MPWRKGAPYKDFSDCLAHMKNKKGVDDPEKYCGALEQKFKVKAEAQANLQNRFHFGIDGIPFYNRFSAGPAEGEDIPLVGTFLDFEPTSNGWFIDPDEEANILNSTRRTWKPKVRVAHSKEPERTIGEYREFIAAEDDGCTDSEGKPLGRHIDFKAVTTPQDPQLRTNIQKGYVGDISPGLDAEVFCSVCDKPWGLDEENKLVKDCEHQEAKGVLRNIIVKEGSIVTEPAFEGRTQFRPNFTMTVNGLFSPDKHEREALGTRPSEGQATDDRRNKIKGGAYNMATQKVAELEHHRAEKLKNAITALQEFNASINATAEEEGTDEDMDEAARIRALKGLKSLKKFEDELAKLGYGKGEDFIQPDKVSGESEDEDEDRKKMATPPQKPDHAEPDEDDMQMFKNMSDTEKKTILQASELLRADEKARLLSQATDVVQKHQEVVNVATLEAARTILEARKDDKDAQGIVTSIKAYGQRLEAERKEKQKVVATSGAQVPSAEPNLGKAKPAPVNAQDAFTKAFNAELVPRLRQKWRTS